MKTKSLIQRAQSNIYYKEFDRLCSLSSEQYEAESRKKEFPRKIVTLRTTSGAVWDQSTKYNYILRSLKLKMLKYSNCFEFNCGIYSDIQCSINLKYSEYRNDKRAKVEVSFYIPETSQRYTFEAPENLILTDLEVLKKLLQTEVFTDGLIALIQLNKRTDKQEAKNWFKIYLQKKYFFEFPTICHDKIQNWIKRKFKIDSYFDINKTIEVVNQIGRQKALTFLRSVDTSFIYDFDGDVDELEGAIYEANPINENIIYIN